MVALSQLSLYHLGYSPWSERARWALDHHGIDYRKVTYSPMFGAWALRLRTGRFRGKLTVPLLKTPGKCYFDSLSIAQYAETHGSGQPLFAGRTDAIMHWNDQSEKALGLGRALLTLRVAQDTEAMRDYLPKWLPTFLHGNLGIVFAKMGIAFFRRKYKFEESQPKQWQQDFANVLIAMSKQLEGRAYLVDDFSYADITMAAALQFLEPVDSPTIRLPKRSRKCWGTPDLAKQFPNLIAWRNELYAKHRNMAG